MSHVQKNLLALSDVLLGLASEWLGVEVIRFIWRSEMVRKVKFKTELGSPLISLHSKILLNAYFFSGTFLFCGLTHVSFPIFSKGSY